MKLGTEEKTILHYGKKIKEYCKSHVTCKGCALATSVYLNNVTSYHCYFEDFPENWEEVDLHE